MFGVHVVGGMSGWMMFTNDGGGLPYFQLFAGWAHSHPPLFVFLLPSVRGEVEERLNGGLIDRAAAELFSFVIVVDYRRYAWWQKRCRRWRRRGR